MRTIILIMETVNRKIYKDKHVTLQNNKTKKNKNKKSKK